MGDGIVSGETIRRLSNTGEPCVWLPEIVPPPTTAKSARVGESVFSETSRLNVNGGKRAVLQRAQVILFCRLF